MNDIETLKSRIDTLTAELRDALDANEKAKCSEFARGRLHMRSEAARFCESYLAHIASIEGESDAIQCVRMMARAMSEYLNAPAA